MKILIGHFGYLEILLIIFVPVAFLSLLTRFSVYRRYTPLAISIIFVAPFYILWDQLAVIYGTWSFNKANVIGLYFFHIPFEEVAFFLVVPFSTIFILEVLSGRIQGELNRQTVISAGISFSILLVIFGIVNISRSYTSIVSFFAAGSIILGLSLNIDLMLSKSLWLYMVISYVPFIIFDHILVTLPVFTYGKGAIIGLKIIGIPVEEFLYVFSLLLSYAIFYDLFRRRIGLEEKADTL